MRRTSTFLVSLWAALLASTAGAASAQTFPLFRTVGAPAFVPQASFYNPVLDQLVVISFGGTNAQIYDSSANLVTPTSPLPTPLGDTVDGAAYDSILGVGLVIRHNCELIELDPVSLAIRSRRMLGGSASVAPPTLCAGVDVGSDGALYVADYNTPRVIVYPRAGSVPIRDFTTSLMLVDNLARAPGTDVIMIATNGGQFALYRESGAFVAGPSPLGTAIILGDHTRTNSAGSDGLTFIGTSGRLWFCDHNDPVVSCYLQTRGCAAPSDCPLPFIGCDLGTGSCLSAVCGDGRIQGGEECDDADTMGGDGCSAGCVIEPGFVCNGEPSVCGTCTDTEPFGVDMGCADPTRHCRTSGPRAPQCEVCIDDQPPGVGDLGCSPSAPFCIRPATENVCVRCVADGDCDDRTECTTDRCVANACVNTSRAAGETCSTGVCGGPGDDRCVECVTDAQCMAGFRCHPGRFCMPIFDDAGPMLPDAALELPDARFELPDAPLELPDASMPPPDAFMSTPPDAFVARDAAMPRDAGARDAGPSAMIDAAPSPDTGPTVGTFTGGAVCSVSPGDGSRAAWAIVLAALATIFARRRNRR